MAYRNLLLPAYLSENPVWQEMFQAFEEVFGDEYDRCIDAISLSRNLHMFTPTEDNTPLSIKDVYTAEREFLVGVSQMLGFNYPNYKNKLFTLEDYLRIAQWLGQYMKAQGLESFMDFFAYCFNAELEIQNLWSENYVDFIPQGDKKIAAIDPAIIGASTANKGGYYPTSHVHLIVDPFATFNLTLRGFRDFFYYVAPINLVLQAIVYRIRMSQTLNYAMVGYTYIIDSVADDLQDEFNISAHGTTTIFN